MITREHIEAQLTQDNLKSLGVEDAERRLLLVARFQLDVLLDIRELLRLNVDTIRADGYDAGFRHGKQLRL